MSRNVYALSHQISNAWFQCLVNYVYQAESYRHFLNRS
jgi:hypothetical protein